MTYRVTILESRESIDVADHREAHAAVTKRTDAAGFGAIKYDGSRGAGVYSAAPSLDGPWQHFAAVAFVGNR